MSFGMAWATKKHNKKSMGREAAEHVEEPAAESEGPAMEDADMIARIMHKRQMYSKGGQVANDVGVAEADKLPAEYDDLVLRADDMESADYTAENSGDELGNEAMDERNQDVISKVLSSRKKKDHNPRPA
jgi:hypothetical protein